MARFECVAPILSITDMARSVAFYVEYLAFENAAWGNEEFTMLSKDGCTLYLCRGAQGQAGTWVWIGVDDARKLYNELRARGVQFRLAPTNYPWALEVQLEDPDGHVLRIGSDPE